MARSVIEETMSTGGHVLITIKPSEELNSGEGTDHCLIVQETKESPPDNTGASTVVMHNKDCSDEEALMISDPSKAADRASFDTEVGATAMEDCWEESTDAMSADSEISILKVPGVYRQPAAEFTPVGWRFGLHNHDSKLDTSGPDAIKSSIAKALRLRGREWDNFCNAIVDDPKSMLHCYGQQEEVANWDLEKLKQDLAKDALFLAIFYGRAEALLKFQMTDEALSDTSSLYRSWKSVARYDICKIENQVPFELIKRVVNYLTESTASQFGEKYSANDEDDGPGNRGYLKRWMKCAVKEGMADFMDVSGDAFENNFECLDLTASKHILGAAYEVICGHEGERRPNPHLRHFGVQGTSTPGYIHIPPASKLIDSGIEIKGLNGPLDTMSYENRVLSLPKMTMNDNTVALIRNMARYEEYHITHDRSDFHDYVVLMTDLIQTPEDLKILVEGGVIHNEIGITAVKRWNALEHGILLLPSSRKYHDIKEEITTRCALRRHRFWSEFITLFCSRPWIVLSTFTIVLITLATLLQTYVSIISSNRMRPEFP